MPATHFLCSSCRCKQLRMYVMQIYTIFSIAFGIVTVSSHKSISELFWIKSTWQKREIIQIKCFNCSHGLESPWFPIIEQCTEHVLDMTVLFHYWGTSGNFNSCTNILGLGAPHMEPIQWCFGWHLGCWLAFDEDGFFAEEAQSSRIVQDFIPEALHSIL